MGLVAGIGALAVGGAATGVVSLTGIDEPTAAPKVALGGSYGVAAVVPTTFGTVAVQQVSRLRGLTHKQVSGVTHFPSFVGADKVQLQVGVELTNLDDRRAAPFSPTLFRLRIGTGKLLPPSGANFRPGRLQPSASLSGVVIFVVPRGNQPLTVEIAEPGVPGARPKIDLGRLATPFEGTIESIGHDHVAKVRNR